MSKREWALFCRQMSLFLKVGVPLDEGLELMLEYSDSVEFEYMIKSMQKEMKKNRRLDQVLAQVEGVPVYMIQVTRIGALAGRLEEALEGLYRYYEKEESLKENMKSTIKYPLILSGMMLAILLVLTTQVLPLFEEVMTGLGTNLPTVAQMALSVGKSIGYIGVVVIALLMVIGRWGIEIIKRDEMPKRLWTVVERTKLSEEIALMQLASALTMLLKSGISIEEALEETKNLIKHPQIKAKLERNISILKQGRSVEKAFKESELFSRMATRMLCVGVHTGCVEEVMEDVAKHYESSLEERLTGLMMRVEPIIVAGLAVVIGGILLSVMLPLIGMMAALG